jgi:thiol:disulfide interchange protein DsbD
MDKRRNAIAQTLALFLMLAFPLWAAAEFVDEEPLDPEVAFALKVYALDANNVRAEWNVHDGYYLYREKFKFQSNTDGIELGTPKFPKGKIKEDEFFGKVETYRGKVAIDIPIVRKEGSPANFELQTVSQGCADFGLCYPPQTVKTSFALPPMQEVLQSSSVKASTPSLFDKLGSKLGFGNDDEFLDVDKAFAFSSEVIDGNTVLAYWDIADGYYLYQNKFKFTLLDADGVEIGQIDYPKGKKKHDEYFGEMEVYYERAPLRLPLIRTRLEPMDIRLQVEYQGCAEAGFCYPPETKTVMLSLPAGEKGGGMVQSTASPASGDEGDRGFFGNLLFAFGIGLLLTFTPCVLPMIPILVGAIVGQSGEQPTKMRAGMLSVSYVMGTAVTYTFAGWLAGYSGAQLQAYTQNPWGIGLVVVILILLALSMFGFYEIQMPSAIQSKLQMKSQNVKGGSMTGTFFLGLISALIVGACVTPLLMLVLGIAIQAGDPVLGASMMFAMAMGMGVFLVLVGVGAGHLLPKAGGWMDIVKYVFGVLLLGVAIYLLTPLEAVPVLILWAILFIVVGVYMGATQAVPEGASKWRYMWKGLGTVLLVWGVLALIGGLQGNRDIMQPIDLSGMTSGSAVVASSGGGAAINPHDLWTQLSGTDDLDRLMSAAQRDGKPVILDYYATWCTDCRRMEKATFANPQVQKMLLDNFVLLQVDVTDPNNESTEAVKKRFKVFGPPAMLFFDKNGKQVKDLNFYGFEKPDEFIVRLNKMV